MLPARHRMRQSADFTLATRSGKRAGTARLVVHLQAGDPADKGPSLVGFVLPKRVGNAVVRNRVQRQLRALMSDRIDTIAQGSRIVIRVMPAAVGTSFTSLATDLDSALRRAHRKAQQ